MNKPLPGLLAAALFFACAAPRPEPAAPPAPVADEQPQPSPANFALEAYEVVESPEDDTPGFFAVYLGTETEPQGRTEIAPKSRRKRWLGALPEGNHLMRFEVYDSTDGVSGLRRPGEAQPRERFIRVEPGKNTSVVLKLYDRGRQSLFSVTREPR